MTTLAGHAPDRSTGAPPAALPVGALPVAPPADSVPAAAVPGAAEDGASVIGAAVSTASVPIGMVPAGVVGGGLDAAPSAGTTRPPPTASSTMALVVDFFTVSPSWAWWSISALCQRVRADNAYTLTQTIRRRTLWL